MGHHISSKMIVMPSKGWTVSGVCSSQCTGIADVSTSDTVSLRKTWDVDYHLCIYCIFGSFTCVILKRLCELHRCVHSRTDVVNHMYVTIPTFHYTSCDSNLRLLYSAIIITQCAWYLSVWKVIQTQDSWNEWACKTKPCKKSRKNFPPPSRPDWTAELQHPFHHPSHQTAVFIAWYGDQNTMAVD